MALAIVSSGACGLSAQAPRVAQTAELIVHHAVVYTVADAAPRPDYIRRITGQDVQVHRGDLRDLTTIVEAVSALQAKGLAGLTVPADAGGKGQGPRAFCAVVEELAMTCPSTAMVFTMHVSATAAIIASFASRNGGH